MTPGDIKELLKTILAQQEALNERLTRLEGNVQETTCTPEPAKRGRKKKEPVAMP